MQEAVALFSWLRAASPQLSAKLLNGELSKTSTGACRACKQCLCFIKSGSSTPLRLTDPCWVVGRIVLLGKLLQLVSETAGDDRHYSVTHTGIPGMYGSPGKVRTWKKITVLFPWCSSFDFAKQT